MALPGISITAQNGSARPTQPASNRVAIFGPTSAGTKEVAHTFTNANDPRGTLGYGPAVEQTEMILSDANIIVDVFPCSASISPELTEVSAASPVIDVSDASDANYTAHLLFKVTTPGGRGEGFFQYTQDGPSGQYSGDILIPSDGQFTVPGLNVSCSFADSTHPAGNTSEYKIKGPRVTTADWTPCVEAMLSGSDTYRAIVLADDNDDPVSGSANFSTMNTELTKMAGVGINASALVNVGGESKVITAAGTSDGTNTYTEVKSNMVSKAVTAGNGIQAIAERVPTILARPIVGLAQPRRAGIFGYAAHYLAESGTDLSRNPLITFVPRWTGKPSHDEQVTTVYNSARIVAPRTFRNLAGLYINNSHNKYTTGGESFDRIYKVDLKNRAADVLKTALQPYIGYNVRTIANGYINPADAAPIEDAVRADLEAALTEPINTQGGRGYCTGFTFTIDKQTNVLSTSTLTCRLRIQPFANIANINVFITLEDSLEVTPSA